MNHYQLKFRDIMQDFGGLVSVSAIYSDHRDHGRTGASPRKGSFQVMVAGM